MSPDNEELEHFVCDALREILGRVGDKWTIVILAALGNKRMRLKDLHGAIEGISQRMLVVTLRNLERDGVMVRIVHATVPPRVEYELSELGRSLRDVLKPVGAWVLANRNAIEASRRRFEDDAQVKEMRALTKT
jgi:DNA-binding HxlR family transcriptional regulator